MVSEFAAVLAGLGCEATHPDPATRAAFIDRLAGLAPQDTLEALADASGAIGLGGTYRIMTLAGARQADGWIDEAFPELAGVYVVFATDWLGRVFAVSRQLVGDNRPPVTLVDVGAGECLHMPVDLEGLHRTELRSFPDAAVATTMFEHWRAAGGDVPAADQCVGYRTPLFLGGADDVTNLQLIDMDVYWSTTGQVIGGIRGRPAQ